MACSNNCKKRNGIGIDFIKFVIGDIIFPTFIIAFLAVLGIYILLKFVIPAAVAEEGSYKQYVSKVCKEKCPDPELLRMATYTAAHEHGVEPALLFAIFQVESSFRPTASNRVGGWSAGLGQIQVRWHRDKFRTKNVYDIFDNAQVAAQVLSDCMASKNGNTRRALWCYNGHQRHGIKRYALKVEKRYLQIKERQFFI